MQIKIGDIVSIKYIYDCCPHNGMVGAISYLHKYKYYPNGNKNEFVYKWQALIKYSDGTMESVLDLFKEGSGLVSPITQVMIQ